MIEFTHDCYKAVSDSDFGNTSRVIGYFTNSSDAEKAGKGKSAWGSDARVSTEKLRIVIFESYDEYEDAMEESAKQAALSKLTDKEKALLGL